MVFYKMKRKTFKTEIMVKVPGYADRILLHNNTHITCKEHGMYSNETKSDHKPIWATLSIPYKNKEAAAII